MKLIAIRRGDYDAVAPGLLSKEISDKALVANLIDTTARDIAEVMAPLPAFECAPANLANKADKDRQQLRAYVANGYVQHSRLQDQMFEGADRYGSFGFLAYIVEPDFKESAPRIRVGGVATAYYTKDYLGRTVEYVEVVKAPVEQIKADFPEAANALRVKYGDRADNNLCEVAVYYCDKYTALILLDPGIVLSNVANRMGRTPVRIVERPNVTGDGPRGQFDDVIGVQVARALVQQFTLEAIREAVEAPIVLPRDVDELQIGPFTAIQTDQPNVVGRVDLRLPPGLFPEQQVLAQEQRNGSRYPEGRSGNIDASIITGQGVQALMGTFDTQVQTFQRLNASALEDVIELCFRMDEAYWPDQKKTRRIRENGSPRKYDYTPSKDIAGDYTVDVSYGAIAGLDPNRGLVFLLQALAGGLISKSTARKSLPVDINTVAEGQQIDLEHMDESIAAALAALPQALPQMAMGGMDPRELVLQFAQLRDELAKGMSPAEAAAKVFAPKQAPQPEVDPMQAAMEQAGQGDPNALPGLGSGGASDLLMSLAGMSPSGRPNLQSTVSRMTPIK
jgi:hypothetical protein